MKKHLLGLITLVGFVLSANAQDSNNDLYFVSPVEIPAAVKKTPLWNPDRGLHLESIYQVSNTEGYIPNPYKYEDYPVGFMDTRNENFESGGDSITITQLYIYLTAFWDTDVISEAGLANVQLLFDGLRAHNVKALLRFAYSRDDGRLGNGHQGANPGYNRTLKHIAQLKPIIEKNWDVIALVEAGFIGTWGEWSPRYGTASQNTGIATSVFDFIPEGYNMVVRYIDIRNSLKSLLSASQMNHIGFCNDYFTTGLKNCGSSDWCMDSDDYKHVAEVSFNAYMRAEIPYNEGPPWGFDILMEPETVLRVLKEHHYSALDITQNYADNITHWKTVSVVPAMLERNAIFFEESYFTEADGRPVPRPLYDFIRDHLGYRLNVLPEPVLNATNNELTYNIGITNTGFATVINPKTAYLVLIDDQNQIVQEIALNDVNTKSWQPWASSKPAELLTHTIAGTAALEVTAGTYKVGLWIPDPVESIKYNPGYCIKFADDNGAVTHWYNPTHAVNIIGEIQF